MSTSKTIAGKIAAISKELGAIAKTGHNEEQGFDFIEYAMVSGRIRELFDKHGLVIIPQVKEILVTESIKSKYGKQGYHFILKMSFQIINADDPNESIERDWLGEAADYGDKGINKAETSGVKYFYMRTFNISEKGDSDNDPDGQDNSIKPAPLKDTDTDFGAIQEAVSNNNSACLDFDVIRDYLDTLDDIESVKAYYEELKKVKQSPAQQKYINGMFNKKKQQLTKEQRWIAKARLNN